MEIGIESYVEGTVIEEGKVAIEAKLLSDIVRKLPDSEIHMETNEDFKTTIKCEKSLFTIAGKSGEDFSSLPVVEKSKFTVYIKRDYQPDDLFNFRQRIQ